MQFIPIVLLLGQLASTGVEAGVIGSPSDAVAVRSNHIAEPHHSTDIVVRSSESLPSPITDLAVIEKRTFAFVLIPLITAAANVISWSVALYGLATSAYSIYKDCYLQYNRNDCVLDSFGLVFSAWAAAYKANGLKRSAYDHGLFVHGTMADPEISGLTAEAHIPLVGGSLYQSSIASKNNGTWERHATFYYRGEETHHLMYRLASEEDLGRANDGSVHHYRVQGAKLDNAKLSPRIEKRGEGVVTDYLWRNNNQDLYNSMHSDQVNFGNMAYHTYDWMANNNKEAACAFPVGSVSTHGGSSSFGVDQGIIAYGWNNKPFGFNGRSGGWIDECNWGNRS